MISFDFRIRERDVGARHHMGKAITGSLPRRLAEVGAWDVAATAVIGDNMVDAHEAFVGGVWR